MLFNQLKRLQFIFLLRLLSIQICSLSIAASAIDEKTVSAIYYEKPSAARFSAPVFKHQQKGCVYNNQKYINGEEVQTDQPCLTCTCKKSVLLCALRVCPPVTHANLTGLQTSQCQIFRKPNACCPTVECVPLPQNEFNEINNNENEIVNFSKGGSSQYSTVTPLIELNSSVFEAISKEDYIDNSESTVIKHNHLLSITHMTDRNTTILQTVPSSSFLANSPMITKPNHSKESTESYLEDLHRGFDKHCFVNGTYYAEGSAIVASSFCEYCYCIRSKRMCIRPRCHLSILGCLPRYSSEYACCPTSYACGEEALITSNITDSRWQLTYSSNDQLLVNGQTQNETNIARNQEADLAILQTDSTSNTETFTVSTETVTDLQFTTTTTSEPTNSYTSSPRMTDCILDGYSYKIGEPMPSNASCTHCYCSMDGNRSCKKIECTFFHEHDCAPVIPEGHCCPIEFKCPPQTDKQQSSNISIKIDDQHQPITSDRLENSTKLDATNFSKEIVECTNGTCTTSAKIEEVTTLKANTTDTNAQESDQKVYGLGSIGNQNKDYDDENLVMSNSHRKMSANLDTRVLTKNDTQFHNRSENTHGPNSKRHILQDDDLEARNIPDESNSTETIAMDEANFRDNEHEEIDHDNNNNNPTNSTIPTIKFKNVANFLNNFFHIFGLTESNSNVNHASKEYSQHESDSVVNDAGGSSMSITDRIGIISAQSSILNANQQDTNNKETTAKLTNQPTKLMPTALKLGGHHENRPNHGDLVKSMRDLQPQNVYPPHKPNYSSNKPPKPQVLFSNGWKVVGPQKIRRPSLKKPSTNNSTNVSMIKPNAVFNENATTLETTTTSSQLESIADNVTSSESQKQLNQSLLNSDLNKIRCVHNGQHYDNGAIINKSNDPCEYCRCFYGNEICQRHNCPLPPSTECIAEKVTNQCCPLYICKMEINSTNTSQVGQKVTSSEKNNNNINLVSQDKSPIRNSPQFDPESVDPELRTISTNLDEQKRTINSFPAPMHSEPLPRISFPFNPLAPPIDFSYISRQENRIHFPNQHKQQNLLNPEMQNPLSNNNANGINKSPVPLNHMVKLNPFINRPVLFPLGGQYGNQIKPNVNQIIDSPNTNFGNQSQIRRRPQFPVQVETEPISNKIPLSGNFTPIAVNKNTNHSHQAVPATTTTSPALMSPSTVRSEPWNILQLSGCNIYGHMYKTNQEIQELGSKCKKCICSSQGVQCNETC